MADAFAIDGLMFNGFDGIIEMGSLRIVPDEYLATVDGRRLRLTRKEFQLLVAFASNPGRVMRRDRLADEVWGGEASGRTIDIHVARLRRHLPPGAIETVIRVGYRFVLG